MGYTSPDGEDGYPGSLTVNVTYSLDGEGGIDIEYKVGKAMFNVIMQCDLAGFYSKVYLISSEITRTGPDD